MIEITSEIYRAVADRLKEEIGQADYFNGTAEFSTDEFYSTLTLSAVIYRRTETLPEGTRRMIADVVPVWWEFSTVQSCGGVLNDFSFSELKQYIINLEI